MYQISWHIHPIAVEIFSVWIKMVDRRTDSIPIAAWLKIHS